MILRRSSAGDGVCISIVVLMACLCCGAAAASAKDRPSPGDTILFDIFRINYAWGFACGGWYIDASGTVHHYDCRALGDTIRTPAYHGREGSLLQHRYRMKDSIVCHVAAKELAQARQLVREAAKMPPQEARPTARDAGSTTYCAFLYDPGSGKRTDVPLATWGDWSRDPSSTAAAHLVKWLEEIRSCKDTIGR